MGVREIHVGMIEETVRSLFLKANTSIGQDIYNALMDMKEKYERSPLGKDILDQILKNHDIARDKGIAMCQDTGMAVVFLDVGQDVHFVGGALEEAVNKGVKGAYEEGYFRKSVVSDPLFDRKNTGTNTPAVIHTRIVKGDRVKILAMPKGFGSENMSALKMLTPAAGVEGVKKFVVDTVMEAGPNPCPPTVIGVGIGGTMEQAALIAKKATARPVGSCNEDPRYSRLEEEILEEINGLGIGPGGLGGTTSCLAVHIEFVPGHIAGIPVAVNICCHACRHAEVTI
ncbi:hydro-lyase, Fe-S type, tartrate/fumarate subfamily, alpha subunit [Thermovirga lienii DSM 17291]|uniref:Hydro-lyase, Fe-S type, tartrate/fumarate subfamily, alpha subunit n=1 Tax=Thermovirga lienii (strain ATCC BAA-1197 / DSM 17291 / Cas60314) TaxID=580340 RepID=G7V7H1_THELD|nr:fumarate hydratase [Thermovirga lienii]AER66133.1 hydro-lyase, Fe-S type, tartrate/fumarate subfamily, alpha subunit [Thermovirga lienii DSM 17291]